MPRTCDQASTPHRVTEHEGEHHMDFPPPGGWVGKQESREREDLPLTQKRMHVLFGARRPRTLQ